MKSRFKKAFISIFAVFTLGFGLQAHAAQLSSSQIQAVVGLLQSFNVDASTINQVTFSLGGAMTPAPTPTPGSWCPSITLNLYQGLIDLNTRGQVSQLQQYLHITPSGYFGPVTRAQVANFQSQNGLLVTGGVGPLTRALIQSKCGGGVTPTPTPTPSPVPSSSVFTFGSPFVVGVGQTATEASLSQLVVTVISVTNPTAQVTLGQNCVRGTQCFYFPQQSYTMTIGQQVSFQGYTVTLNSVGTIGATFTATSNSGGTVPNTPVVSSITPMQGAVGTQITIFGNGFTSDNVVHFGIGGTQHVTSSNNGTAITYTIPSQVGPCNLVVQGQQMCAALLQLVTPGTYNISVSNANGQSMPQSFTIVGAPVSNVFALVSPVVGQTFNRGQDLTVVWSSNATMPITAGIVLDLYTAAGSKVGTFAVASNTTNTATWHIPGFPQNYMCTMQYPNGLCGTAIPTGQYYIRATALADGFNSNSTQYGTAQSGVFTIVQQ